MFVARSYDSAGGIMCVKSVCHTQQFTNDIYMMYELGTHVHMDVHLHMYSIMWWESEISMCSHVVGSRMIHTQMNVHMW